VSYFDVQLKAGSRFQHTLPADNHSFLYLFEGNGELNGKAAPTHTLIAFASADHSPEFIAGKQGARFILISGKPINEPVAQYGPFVMNTREEIDQAIHDYQSNNFVRERAWINR
jgi:redox-sensitive bicupin YhaK (pirin superfamily)